MTKVTLWSAVVLIHAAVSEREETSVPIVAKVTLWSLVVLNCAVFPGVITKEPNLFANVSAFVL